MRSADVSRRGPRRPRSRHASPARRAPPLRVVGPPPVVCTPSPTRTFPLDGRGAGCGNRRVPPRRPKIHRVAIYDTTLRDGTQAEGISLTLADKLAIAHRLDELGFDYVEGGWPGSNPKDEQFFAAMVEQPLARARLTAFGSTRRRGVRAE